MPLLGKIVVIKRQGGDGTEFPLTASCLFGRKLDCDIRIQLPQVSKEHCKIELNENKELILTNLSSVNPTRINGQVVNQSELLKHGDLITIIDRSFRFEYPPPKTPKKRLSTAGKDKTVQALQDQQEKSTPVPVEKRKSEHSFDTCLKDGSNLPLSMQQTVEVDSEDGKLKKDSMSPFGELYQMVKQDLVAKSPWKSDVPKTPLARPKIDKEDVLAADVKSTPKQVTTPSSKKRRSSKFHSEDATKPATPQKSFNANPEEKPADDIHSVGSGTPLLTEKSATPVSQKKKTPSKSPQKFSAGEVVQQILLVPHSEGKAPKSPKERRSGASQDQSLALQKPSGQPQTPGSSCKNMEVKMSPRTSPRSNAGKRFQVQEVVQEVKAATSASKKKADTSVNKPLDGKKSERMVPKPKRKRVSFGGQLSPELFDKRLPPNSPLRRGATPRRSLGPFQKPQSLLRRASTIGLLALRLEEAVPEAQKASPKRAASLVKTPSPAKRSTSTKAKTPSPKNQKSPSAPIKVSKPSSPATPKTTKRASTSATETPKVQGRFSISRVSTPSPIQDQVEKPEVQSTIAEDMPQKCVTPKIPLKRKSMKLSARKTPKSAIKSAFDVIRSRRSGASCANLKVLTSWADIVKFGQTKPPTAVTTKKKPAKSIVVKKTAVRKPKTPMRRLKDDISTGHAASPLTIVVGKAHMRTNQPVGAAPKIVPNVALFKKDMKMDEDFTGVADIFKTPANSKSKNIVLMNNEFPEVPVDEISVMKTPEESGEMIVSPLSVISTSKCGRYNNEAVTRLLLDNQDDSLLEDESLGQLPDSSNEAIVHDIIVDQEMPPIDQTQEEEAAPETPVETPKQKTAPSLCLTGVKRLMKTPKQRAEPIEDLRGKLLKTPKDKKPPQEENLEGVKELLKTPKCKEAQVEDIVGVKTGMQTQKEKNCPVLCGAGLQRLMKTPKEKSVQNEDLTGVKELMKTPKLKGDQVENQFGLKRLVKTPKQKRKQVEEDLTGVQHLMKTPKHKGEPVEDQMGIKRLMQTPKEKVEPVEDLTGVKQLMQTPKQKGQPVSNQFGISKMMKTPRLRGVMAEEDFTGLKELVDEPEMKFTLTTENSVTEPFEVQEPVLAVESDLAFIPAEDLDDECDKENETDVVAPVDLQCASDSNPSDLETETVIPQEQPGQFDEKSVSAEAIDDCSSGKDEKIKAQSEESVSTSSTAEQEEAEQGESSLANKNQHGSRGRGAQKCKYDNELAKAPAVLSLIEEDSINGPLPSSPLKKVLEVPEVTASPVRKSARGRISKRTVDDACQVPTDSMKTKIPDRLPVVTKTRKGRKATQEVDVSSGDHHCPDATEEPVKASVVRSGRRKKMNKTESKTLEEDAGVESIHDVNSGVPQCPNAPTAEEPVQAPVVRSGRRKKIDKTESQPSEELEQTTSEMVCEENVGMSEGVKMQTSQGTETLSATRARRGKPSKKEHLKTEPTQILESETPAVVVAEKPPTSVAKSGRGKNVKQEIATHPSLDDDVIVSAQTVAEASVDHKEPQTPLVKSGRGRKVKQQKPQLVEEDVDQPAKDTSTHLPVTEEYTETVVKPLRGNRKTKQSKVAVSAEAEENLVAETPVVKSGRKRAVISQETETEAEGSVKRGRRAVAVPAPSVSVVSSRGRKAESEVSKDVSSSEEPVKPVKNTRRTAKVPVSKKEEIPMTQAGSEFVAAENTAVVALEKAERGSRGKKQKDSIKNIPVNESATAEEIGKVKPSKTVNWNPDLVASQETEVFEPSADVEEPQLKKSKRLGKLPAETLTRESNQSTDLPPRGRRGRGAAKQEKDLPVEGTQEEAQINVKPLRRGKAVASAVPKSEPSDRKRSTPLKRKRNEVLEVAEPVNKEPLPKRRGRVASSAEAAAEVPSKEKIPEAEPEKVNPKRTARGLKKTAQEPDPAPAQEPVSGTATRKGRGVKKVEKVDVTAEAAPVRRTRRK